MPATEEKPTFDAAQAMACILEHFVYDQGHSEDGEKLLAAKDSPSFKARVLLKRIDSSDDDAEGIEGALLRHVYYAADDFAAKFDGADGAEEDLADLEAVGLVTRVTVGNDGEEVDFKFESALTSSYNKDMQQALASLSYELQPDRIIEKTNDEYAWKVYARADDLNIFYFHFPYFNKFLIVTEISLEEVYGAPEDRAAFAMIAEDKAVMLLPTLPLPARDTAYYFAANLDRDTDSSAYVDLCCKDAEYSYMSSEFLAYALQSCESTLEHSYADPFVDSSTLVDSDLEFLCGSFEDLQRDLTLFLHSAVPMHVWDALPNRTISVCIIAAVRDDGGDIDYPAELSWTSVDASSIFISRKAEAMLPAHINETLREVVSTLIELNYPVGHYWEYNDGAVDRMSGYSKSGLNVTIDVAAPSAHEQIGAKMSLKDKIPIFGKKIVETLTGKDLNDDG